MRAPARIVHERALAGAVLADERVHLAGRRRRRSTPPSATVAPKDFRTPRADQACERAIVYSPSHFLRSGWRSSLIAGSSMFSLVTSRAPVSMRASTFSPRRCAAHRLDGEVAHVERVLDDEPVDVRRLRAPRRASSELSKPTNFTLPASPAFWSARSMPNVVDSFGQKMPSTPPSLAFCAASRFSLFGERALGGGAAVLVVAHDLDAGVLLDRVEEAVLAVLWCSPSPPGSGARRPCPCRRGACASSLAGELAGREVVGRDEAHVVVALEIGVEDDDRDLRPAFACLHRADEPLVVERRERRCPTRPAR